MAKRPPPPPQRAELTPAQKRAAIPRLEQRVADIAGLDLASIQDRDDPRITGLEASIERTIADIFGPNTHEYRQLRAAATIDTAPHVMSLNFGRGSGRGGTSIQEVRDGLVRGCQRATALLQEAANSFKEELLYSEGAAAAAPEPVAAALPLEVFIVHGHDNAAKEQAWRCLTNAGLKPIILNEQASSGRTVIEKLERYSDVGFAVVLLTPDDVGGPAGGEMQSRARQNVIAELFYFIGKLTRSRVCALMKGQVEIPSDIGGVVYVPLDDRGAWKTDLLKELEAAGYYHIDWKKALS